MNVSNIAALAADTSVAVIFLLLLARILGKKQITQLTLFDYIVGISIGSIAASISTKSTPLFDGIVTMVVWTIFPLLFSFISAHSIKCRKLLEGTPTILVQNGKIIEKNLRQVKFTINDLLEELRIKDAFRIDEIEYAILETNGKLSILKKSQKQAMTPSDLRIPTDYQGISANVIIDGQIMDKNLSVLKMDLEWLMNELMKHGILSVEDVLLACYRSDGTLQIDMKNNDPEVFNVLL